MEGNSLYMALDPTKRNKNFSCSDLKIGQEKLYVGRNYLIICTYNQRFENES